MPTEDAYLRTCRALNWRTAQLRANGIEPLKLTDEHPHEPPIGFDFNTPSVEELDWLLDTFIAYNLAAEKKRGADGPGFPFSFFAERQRAEIIVNEWKANRLRRT